MPVTLAWDPGIVPENMRMRLLVLTNFPIPSPSWRLDNMFQAPPALGWGYLTRSGQWAVTGGQTLKSQCAMPNSLSLKREKKKKTLKPEELPGLQLTQ